MKNKVQVIFAVIFGIIFLGYLVIDGKNEDTRNQKFIASLKEGILISDFNCEIESTYRNIYYNCNINGFNIGTILFLEMSKVIDQPITASSKINLPKNQLKVYYSNEFQCVVNPFKRASLLGLINSLECLPNSKDIIPLIKSN